MKKIYVIPTLNIESVDVQQQILAGSIKVDGENKVESSTDIGFVKENQMNSDGFWEDTSFD
ncbi:MAG: hypothetical protein K6A32_08850 [Bacteroidales bacterium]|nr:hypothetical protein [Bacteroidales bacterium]